MIIQNGDEIITIGRTGWDYSRITIKNKLESDYDPDSDYLVEWLMEELGIKAKDINTYKTDHDIDHIV